MFTVGAPLWGSAAGGGGGLPVSPVLLHHLDGSTTPAIGGSFTTYGSPSFEAAPGGFGQALDMNGVPSLGGSNCVGSTSATASYDVNSGDFTISLRMKALSTITVAAPYYIFALVTGDSALDYAFYLYPTNQVCVGVKTEYSFTIMGYVNITVGEWVHLEFSRSGNTQRFFVNGVLRDSRVDVYRIPASAKRVYLGNGYPSIPYGADVVIDEVLIIPTCLHTSNFEPPSAPYTYP